MQITSQKISKERAISAIEDWPGDCVAIHIIKLLSKTTFESPASGIIQMSESTSSGKTTVSAEHAISVIEQYSEDPGNVFGADYIQA